MSNPESTPQHEPSARPPDVPRTPNSGGSATATHAPRRDAAQPNPTQPNAPDPVDQIRPIPKTLLLGLQHVLVMAATPISSVFLVAGVLQLEPDLTARLLATVLVLSGVGTIIQSFGLGPFGSRLPFVMLPGGAPVILFISIAQAHNAAVAVGAVVLTGIFILLAVPIFTRLLRFFPPLVIGTMILIVGVNLVLVGAKLIFGRPGTPEFGNPSGIGLGMGTIAITVLIFMFARGVLRRIAVMLGLVGGALLAAVLGRVPFGDVSVLPVVEAPTVLPFGVPEFNLLAAVPLLLFSLASMAEATGQTAINAEAVGRKGNLRRDAARTIRGDALVSIVGGGVFGTPMMVTSGENVGIVRITGVKSRFVTVAAGLILIVIGFLAPISSIINVIPAPVIGGTAIVVFAVIIVLGVQMIARTDLTDEANMFIVAVSVGLGLVPILLPDAYMAFDPNLRILLESGVAVGALSAAVLNALFYHMPWNRRRVVAPEQPPEVSTVTTEMQIPLTTSPHGPNRHRTTNPEERA